MGFVVRRADQPGDLGWMVWRTARCTPRARLGPVVRGAGRADRRRLRRGPPDPRLGGWIAELDGGRVGCVICVPAPDAPGAAVLRILLVTPDARGHGVGAALVDACVEFARLPDARDGAVDQRRPGLGSRDLPAAGFELVA